MANWIEEPAPYDGDKSPQENKQRSRGIVRCDCGKGVDLSDAMYGPDYAAACECRRLFNLSGQQLAPRNQWED